MVFGDILQLCLIDGPPPYTILATKTDIRNMMIDVFNSFLNSVKWFIY